jgi:NAD(P)H-flavin reductase
VHVATDATTDAALAREPCSYIKLCVPAISVVWHPFTVFRSCGGNEQDETPQTTMRLLFRPVGPFTAQLAQQLVARPRPIAIFDGLYSVGNHATRAMTHDYVVIVAGGVAISPYLSLIPNLLERLRVAATEEHGTAVLTKKIVLHWACREEGLIRYVRDTYLDPMLVRAAHQNHIVTFQVHIYHTGSVPPPGGHVSGHVSMDDDAAIFETPVEDNITTTAVVEIVDETVVMVQADVTTSAADVDGLSLSTSTGFAIGLARMMPGRYHSVWQNLPLFAALMVMFGTGQWIYFYFDVIQIAQAHYNPYLGAWISNVIWLVVVIFLSLIIERVAQWSSRCRLYPTRMSGDNDPYLVSCSALCEELDDDMMLMRQGESSAVVHYEEHVGRPVLSELLDEPRRVATAPAIFVCGPDAMTDALRCAAQDSDAFGLVRFVLYEERFEM